MCKTDVASLRGKRDKDHGRLWGTMIAVWQIKELTNHSLASLTDIHPPNPSVIFDQPSAEPLEYIYGVVPLVGGINMTNRNYSRPDVVVIKAWPSSPPS